MATANAEGFGTDLLKTNDVVSSLQNAYPLRLSVSPPRVGIDMHQKEMRLGPKVCATIEAFPDKLYSQPYACASMGTAEC